MRKKCLSILLLFPVFLICLGAEEKDRQKDTLHHEVVVTATRIETPLQEIASSVTVISRQDLEKAKKATLIEVLQDIVGLSVIQSGPWGSSASVQLRGANSEHTLVMIDGVEVNDPITPSRTYDLSHLRLESIERIEILRGPQSPLYGSDAMAGVINIITRKGQGKPQFHLSSLDGSYGTFSGTAGLTGTAKELSYSLWASSSLCRGFSAANSHLEGNTEADGYKNFSLSARAGYTPFGTVDVDFLARFTAARSDIDNFGGAFGDDPNNVQRYDSLLLKGCIRGLLLKNRWEQKLTLSRVDSNRETENPVDEQHLFDSDSSRYKSRLFKLDWQNNLFLHQSNTLTFGAEHQEEWGESAYYSENTLGSSQSLFPEKKARSTGFYIQDQQRVSGRFFLTAGMRLDSHSQTGLSATYRIAPAFFIRSTNTKLKATYGTGFKSPSLYQLYAPGTVWGPVGNENLEPEETSSWDAGIEQVLLDGKILVTATYFSSHLNNLIDYDSTLGYINISSASSKGIEFLAEFSASQNLFLAVSYSHTEAKDRNTGEALLRRPKDKFTARADFLFSARWHCSLSLIHLGARDDQQWIDWVSTRVRMTPSTLLNATVSYDIHTLTQLFLRLDNILDADYELIKGYGTPGFSAYGGFEIRF
jgi:vitamin B12 transporter